MTPVQSLAASSSLVRIYRPRESAEWLETHSVGQRRLLRLRSARLQRVCLRPATYFPSLRLYPTSSRLRPVFCQSESQTSDSQAADQQDPLPADDTENENKAEQTPAGLEEPAVVMTEVVPGVGPLVQTQKV